MSTVRGTATRCF